MCPAFFHETDRNEVKKDTIKEYSMLKRFGLIIRMVIYIGSALFLLSGIGVPFLNLTIQKRTKGEVWNAAQLEQIQGILARGGRYYLISRFLQDASNKCLDNRVIVNHEYSLHFRFHRFLARTSALFASWPVLSIRS